MAVRHKALAYLLRRLVLMTLMFVTLVILAVVWITTLNAAKRDVALSSATASSILERVIQTTNEQFYQSAMVLTADFGFKQAVAIGDEDTVKSVLQNHKDRVAADILLIADLDGKVRNSSINLLEAGYDLQDQPFFKNALSQSGGFGFFQYDGQLFSMTAMPVLAPNPIAIALVGFLIDAPFVRSLSDLVGQDLVITTELPVDNPYRATGLTVSSLSPKDMQTATGISVADLNIGSVFFSPKMRYIEDKNKVYEQPALDVYLTMLTLVGTVFDDDIALLGTIAWFSVIALVISFFLAQVFSARLTSPLNELISTADDIAKGNYDEVVRKKSDVLEIDKLYDTFIEMRQQVQERENHIIFQANHDALTGIYNRNKLFEVLNEFTAQQKSTPLIKFKIIDLRNLFEIFGYEAGERLIQIVALRLLQLGGIVARAGGSDFIWLPAPSRTDVLEPTIKTLKDLRQMMARAYTVDGQIIKPRFALGFLRYPQDALNPAAALMRLNIAIDSASQHQSLVAFYTQDLEAKYLRRLDILNELKQELASDQPSFSLNFQPKFRVKTLKPERAEALLRWNSPKLGFVPPDVFIGIAEQAGLIHPITRWVVSQVIRQQFVWRKTGIDIQVAINLSVHDIENDTFLGFIQEELDKYNLPAKVLSFEVTESGLMNDPAKVIEQLHIFADFGFTLSIDDFGTGYSSLSYLKEMPVEELKIDKAFVLKLDQDVNDQVIAQTVLSMAHRFHLEVVAEGIENSETLRLLDQWNCEWAQGFYLSRPIAQANFGPWYKEYDSDIFLQAMASAR